MKSLVLTITIILFGVLAFGQLGTIKGTIQTDNLPLEYATVSIFDLEDQLITGSISDEKGRYAMEDIPYGTYILKAEFLGFAKYEEQVTLSNDQKKVKVKPINLVADATVMDDVVVTAEKSAYSVQLDKRVFNVGKDIMSQGGTALDALDQVPLVSVDPTGSIQLRGSGQVQILINGRRSGLTQNNGIEQIEAENIDRIEVITNPSASFDANGSAGIINIILKKNKGEGWNGQIRAMAGYPDNYVLMPALNYKSDKLNVFSNFRWRYSDYRGRYSTDQINRSDEGDQISALMLREVENRHDDGRSAYIGADYQIDDKNSVTVAFFKTATKDTDGTKLNYTLQNELREDLALNRLGNSVENRSYNQLESNYTRTFHTKGRKLTADLQYDFWDSQMDWSLNTSGEDFDGQNGNDVRTVNIKSSKDFAARVDYNTPFRNGKLSTGLKWENRVVFNDFYGEELVDEQWETYRGIDNEIEYAERIGAAYVEFKSSIKKFDYQLGLRSEMTDVVISDEEGVYDNQSNYINLFPSAFATYNFSQGASLQLSYSKRINRPSLWDIYPFNGIKDFNSYWLGNPNLTPSYTDAYELSYIHVGDKITLNPGIYHRVTHDALQVFVDRDEQDAFVYLPINIDSESLTGAEVTMRYRPYKFLSFNGEARYSIFNQKGQYEGRDLNATGTIWRGRVAANMSLPKDIDFQVRYDYRGPSQNAQINYLASYDLSFAVSKDFLDNKVNVNLRASNVLDSRIRRTEVETPTYSFNQSSRRTGPQFNISVLYKWNVNPRQRMRTANRGNRS